MSRGKRCETEGKLNYQKVFAVIIAIIVLIMFIFIIKDVFKQKNEDVKSKEYFALFDAEKWGIINQVGEIVINPSYREMLVIPDKNRDVFICTYDINEETGEYKTKAINGKNETIFQGYDQIEGLENFDKNDNVWYEKNLLKVKKDLKYGLIDLTGKEILPIEYDKIYTLDRIENSIIIEKNGKKGLVNETGTIIIEPKYVEIKNLGETFKTGYIVKDENSKLGIISSTKRQILENKYDEIKPIDSEENYFVKEADKFKLVNSKGETIIDQGFDNIIGVNGDKIIFEKNKLFGIMDFTGKVIIEPQYQDLKHSFENNYIAKQNDKYGVINLEKENKVEFKYNEMTYDQKAEMFFAEDEQYKTTVISKKFNDMITGILSEINLEKQYMRLRVGHEYKYYDFSYNEKTSEEILKDNTLFLRKENGKYGFVDKKGNVVVDYIYDDGTEQNELGYAAIKKDGLWGAIDREGKIVIDPKYNLDNNFIIDFIGKWHLGEDININYYCKE